MFRAFDQNFIGKLEKLTHRCQVRFGRDNFFLARVTIWTSILMAWILRSAVYTYLVSQGEDPISQHILVTFLIIMLGLAPLYLLVVAIVTLFYRTEIAVAESEAWHAVRQGLRNPREHYEFYWRIFAAPLCAALSIVVPALGLVYLAVFVNEYQLAVTPLHPNEVAREQEKRAAAKLALRPHTMPA